MTLSPSVRQVAELAQQGVSRQDIALRLNLSLHTVRGYVTEARHAGLPIPHGNRSLHRDPAYASLLLPQAVLRALRGAATDLDMPVADLTVRVLRAVVARNMIPDILNVTSHTGGPDA